MSLLRVGFDVPLGVGGHLVDTPAEGGGESAAGDGCEGGAPREGDGGAAEDHCGSVCV